MHVLLFIVLDAAPMVTAVMSTVVVLKGSDAILQVTMSGASPDVPNDSNNRTWFHPNSTLITADSKYTFASDRYTLTIKGVSLNDGGMYTFTAANTVGKNTVTIALTIGFPVITQQLTFDPNPVNETGTLIGTCKATAAGSDPKPSSFKWYKDEVELSAGDRISISATTESDGSDLVGTLMITAMMSSDDGNYKCTAVSSVGNTISVSVKVTVQSKAFLAV